MMLIEIVLDNLDFNPQEIAQDTILITQRDLHLYPVNEIVIHLKERIIIKSKRENLKNLFPEIVASPQMVRRKM